MNTYNWLCVAILATEWHVKWKCLTVTNVCITCLWATESINSTVEWFRCFHIHQYFCIRTLEWYIITYTVRVTWWISYCFISHRLTVNTGWWNSWHRNHWWLACRCSGYTWLTCDRNSCFIYRDATQWEGREKQKNQSMISLVTCDIGYLSFFLFFLPLYLWLLTTYLNNQTRDTQLMILLNRKVATVMEWWRCQFHLEKFYDQDDREHNSVDQVCMLVGKVHCDRWIHFQLYTLVNIHPVI